MIPRSDFGEGQARALVSRLIDVENEFADVNEHVRLLVSLQTSFETIARTRRPDDVIDALLIATHDPLAFARALFFRTTVDAGYSVTRRRDDAELSDDDEPALNSRVELDAIVRGARARYGDAGDLSSPLSDARNWYVVCPVAGADGLHGFLYVDGHPSETPRAWEIELVRALATIAAVAYENSTLLTRTHELATRDSLTGLLNRRSFAERLLGEVERTKRGRHEFAYVMIDVDDFKGINDACGHQAGDDVLRRIARTLEGATRSQDVIGRYGGDEFVVLLVDVDDGLTRSLVERVSLALSSADLRCSIGAARCPGDATDAASLLASADAALYATKAKGKNGFSLASR